MVTIITFEVAITYRNDVEESLELEDIMRVLKSVNCVGKHYKAFTLKKEIKTPNQIVCFSQIKNRGGGLFIDKYTKILVASWRKRKCNIQRTRIIYS